MTIQADRQEGGASSSGGGTARDPRHIREDCIEENGDESIPYAEYYDGADEYPVQLPSDQKKTSIAVHEEAALALVPAHPPPAYCDYRNMAVIPGKCVRGFLDITSFIICILLIIVQYGLLDYYYLTNLKEKFWWGWLIADGLVLIVLVWTLVLAIKHNQESMEEICSEDSKVKYAWIAWFFYSSVLVGKVAVCFRLFHDQLPPDGSDHYDKLFDDHLFKLGLSLSVLIFVFLLEAHHYTPLMSKRQLYVTYLTTAVCLDLIDTIYFLDLLWQSVKDLWDLPLWLDITILSLAMFNFILPTFALFKLRFRHLTRVMHISEKIWALLYVLLVNGPYLGIRIYLYILLEIETKQKRYDASLFVVKNIAVTYLAIREVWTRLQYWRQKRRALASCAELTAPGANDDEN